MLFVFFFYAQAAEAATFYVAKTGSNSNSCIQAQSQSTPKLTIAAGVACLSSGDTLNIKAGTYAESFTSAQFVGKSGTSYSNATTIQAFGSDVVTARGVIFNSPGTGNAIRYIVFKNFIFDGDGSLGTILQFGGGGNGGTVDHIKIDGVDAFNPASGAGNGFIVSTGGGDGVGTDIWITRSKIHGAVCGSGNKPAHALYISSPNNLVEYNEIYGARGYGIHNYSGNPSGNIYRYNWIHDNGDNGSCVSQTAWGILLATGNNNQAYGNLIINNQQGINVWTDNNLVYNNTVYGSGVGAQYSALCCYEAIRIDRGNGNVVRNNIVFRNAANRIMDNGTGSFVSNNLTTDPKFVNPSGNDFRLQSSSPAIDTGVNVAPTVIADYAGVPMPQGCCYDIGAYEFGGTPAPSPTPTPPPSFTKFQVGGRVQVTSGPLNVRELPSISGLLFGAQPTGALGAIIFGPIVRDGYTWWDINYDTGVNGWSVENWLK